ncbi:MAG: hypothetical protein KGN00_00445 [Chloroflexota bacterium]|nr:hypothetical protein [Chloroflexota bacterium]MDE3192129.1 hypothetical protein [Chloroflexota bacterium]
MSGSGTARSKPVRPDPALLWPAYTLFPLAGLLVLVFGGAGRDGALIVIGVGLLAINAAMVANQLYFTTIAVEGNELVYRSWLGLQQQAVALGSIQRIDAKRYAGAHGGVSAPHLLARGRQATVRVNTKAYRLRDIAGLIDLVRAANPRVEVDEFWVRVARGEDVSKEVEPTPRARF